MGGETMTGDRELARRVVCLTAVLAGLLAGACGLGWGAGEAAGALAGSAVMLVNFAGLEWAARRVLREATRSPSGAVRPALWLGASGVRLLVVALALGTAAAQGWVGLAGLLVSLTIVPVTVVAVGLMAARAA